MALLMSSCESDPTGSDEYRALEAELSSVEEDLRAARAELAATSAELAPISEQDWVGDHEVTVTLKELGEESGSFELAGVLYPVSGSLPIGGFVSPANRSAEDVTYQVMAAGLTRGWGGWSRDPAWMPLSEEPLGVAPGDYLLVLWADDPLTGFAPWTPAKRDGSVLVGCIHPVTVTEDPVIDVVFETDPFTPGAFGACASSPVPITEPTQGLYGDGDINCWDGYHVADSESVLVGNVEFRPGEREITVDLELSGAAPSMLYYVEIWSPEQCFSQIDWWEHFTPQGGADFVTDETGNGQVEFVLSDVAPGSYRLNVDVVATQSDETWPEGVDPRLREIGGTGFSLVQVQPS